MMPTPIEEAALPPTDLGRSPRPPQRRRFRRGEPQPKGPSPKSTGRNRVGVTDNHYSLCAASLLDAEGANMTSCDEEVVADERERGKPLSILGPAAGGADGEPWRVQGPGAADCEYGQQMRLHSAIPGPGGVVSH